MQLLDLGAERETFNTGRGNLGLSIRVRRQELDLTQQQVAERAGLSTGFISQVERNLATPSLSSLVQIAHALETETAEFLKQPVNTGPITRRNARQRYRVGSGTVEYERVSVEFADSCLNTILIRVPPGYACEAQSHPGEELYYVLEGTLICIVDGEAHRLERGDSIHFNATRLHHYKNVSDRWCVAMWTGTLSLFR